MAHNDELSLKGEVQMRGSKLGYFHALGPKHFVTGEYRQISESGNTITFEVEGDIEHLHKQTKRTTKQQHWKRQGTRQKNALKIDIPGPENKTCIGRVILSAKIDGLIDPHPWTVPLVAHLFID